MKPDISSKEDIKLIITKFYDKLLADEKLFPFFKDIVTKNQLAHHLEIITNFWNDILFDTTTYKNNTMQKHLDKNAFVPFKKEHFTSWMSYLFTTIDTFFSGLVAQNMKNRATSIATVMQLKMKIYK